METVEKYKKLNYKYCVHSLKLKSSSVKFYKTYTAAERYRNKQLENPNILLSTIFELKSFKAIFI